MILARKVFPKSDSTEKKGGNIQVIHQPHWTLTSFNEHNYICQYQFIIGLGLGVSQRLVEWLEASTRVKGTTRGGRKFLHSGNQSSLVESRTCTLVKTMSMSMSMTLEVFCLVGLLNKFIVYTQFRNRSATWQRIKDLGLQHVPLFPIRTQIGMIERGFWLDLCDANGTITCGTANSQKYKKRLKTDIIGISIIAKGPY